jgi:hypothetical protein
MPMPNPATLQERNATVTGTPGRSEIAMPAIAASSSTSPARTNPLPWRLWLSRACSHEPHVHVSVGSVMNTPVSVVEWCSTVVNASVT